MWGEGAGGEVWKWEWEEVEVLKPCIRRWGWVLRGWAC